MANPALRESFFYRNFRSRELKPFARREYWEYTEKVVQIQTAHDEMKSGISRRGTGREAYELNDARTSHEFGMLVRSMGKTAKDLNQRRQAMQSVGRSTVDIDHARHRLALNILLARRNVEHPLQSLPGLEVVSYKYLNYEAYHEYSQNRVEINLPDPDKDGEVVLLTSNLSTLAQFARAATNLPIQPEHVGFNLARGEGSIAKKESQDDFITRRVRELEVITDIYRNQDAMLGVAAKRDLGNLKDVLMHDFQVIWVQDRKEGRQGRIIVQIAESDTANYRGDLIRMVVRLGDGNHIFIGPAPWVIEKNVKKVKDGDGRIQHSDNVYYDEVVRREH